MFNGYGDQSAAVIHAFVGKVVGLVVHLCNILKICKRKGISVPFTKFIKEDVEIRTQLIFNSLFSAGRRTVTSDQLADDFYQTVSEGKTMVMDTFHQPDTELFTPASRALKAVLIGLAIAVTLFTGYAICYAWRGGFDLYPFLLCTALLGAMLLSH